MKKSSHRFFGAHLSTAGGMEKALEKIVTIGGNCLQIFSTSPRGWNTAKVSAESAKKFIEKKKELRIDPIYFHASYLINLADKGSTGHLSKRSLIAELVVAKELGVKGSIVHLGSFKAENADGTDHPFYPTLIKNIKEVLARTPKETFFMIENAGNRKIGRSLNQIASIIKDVGSERVRVCLDTCHLFSAGYEFSTKEKLDAFLKDVDAKIGLDRLELIHANDSRDPFASMRDRHENIGEGTLGKALFKLLINHPKLKHLPFILEVPGFDDLGPDKRNLDILTSLVGEH